MGRVMLVASGAVVALLGLVFVLGLLLGDTTGPADDAGPRPRDVLIRMHDGVEDGTPCAGLFRLRNDLDPSSDARLRANEILRGVGCYSTSSTRDD